jgi:excisionase family DNA binding protein
MPKTTSRTPANRRERRHPDLIGLVEAADYCDVSHRSIRRWIKTGHLRAYRVGPRLLKVSITELEAMRRPVGGAS